VKNFLMLVVNDTLAHRIKQKFVNFFFKISDLGLVHDRAGKVVLIVVFRTEMFKTFPVFLSEYLLVYHDLFTENLCL
jgi:hypothetical protein